MNISSGITTLFLKRTQYRFVRSIVTATVVAVLGSMPAIAKGEASEAAPPVSLPAAVRSGQTPSVQVTPPDRINYDYIKAYATDSTKIITSPWHWDGTDWLKAGVTIGAASGLYLLDTDIRNVSRRNASSAGDTVATVGSVLGNPFYTLPSLGLFYLYGHVSDNPQARRTSLLAVESLAISGLFTLALKELAQRPRPDSGHRSTTWYGPRNSIGDYSFPSNHTAAAFSIAAVLAEEYGSNPYVPPVAYGLATLTGLSRVYDDKHWASDVFFGAAIGYFVGKAVVHYHTDPAAPPLQIMPTVSRQGFTLSTLYRF